MNSSTKAIIAGIIGFVALIGFLIINPLVKVDAGERGVVLAWGAVEDRILNEGIHWITPIKRKVKKMDVTIQKEEQGASAASKDLQIVTSKVAINYHLDPLNVNKLYQDLKKDYSDRVINPAIEEFVKKTTARYTAEELITKREEVKQDLKAGITKNLVKNHIIVNDIFITDFDFSDQFNKSIEAKVTAEQRALEEKNKLEQVKFQAEQKITQATADAEAIRIQAEAITSQGGKDYVSLQWIKAWGAGGAKVPTYVVAGGNNGFLFNLNK